MSLCLAICIPLSITVCLSVSLSLYIYLNLCFSVCLFLTLSDSHSVSLTISIWISPNQISQNIKINFQKNLNKTNQKKINANQFHPNRISHSTLSFPEPHPNIINQLVTGNRNKKKKKKKHHHQQQTTIVVSTIAVYNSDCPLTAKLVTH